MKFIIIPITILLVGCSDPNSKAEYGETGLPKNCRAIVQDSIDSWKKEQYPTEEIMESLERNCGADGYSWKQ